MMTLGSRREVVAALVDAYWAAKGKERSEVINRLVAVAGYNRKYAIHLLRHPPGPRQVHRRHRKRKYDGGVEHALVQVWRAANCICAKRLIPNLADYVDALERFGELHLDPSTRELLLGMSISTADRILHPYRVGRRGRGLATTKPGTLLKQQIPVRTFADWDDSRPGFVEIDLVAHCDQSAEGQYLNSLTMTDIRTAWTECVGLLNKSQREAFRAIVTGRKRFPFPLLGIDSDNGSEFINAHLTQYCTDERLSFTRSREYRKNDQAHVEQKNWSVVRQFVGYDRYEGAQSLQRLDDLYDALREYVNHFQPVLKLVSKQRVGAKLHKRYDRARTPYQRVLDCEEVSQSAKEQLRQRHLRLNPAALLRDIERLQSRLWARGRLNSHLRQRSEESQVLT